MNMTEVFIKEMNKPFKENTVLESGTIINNNSNNKPT